jgi:hypothetical protein
MLALQENEILCPEAVLAQMKLESAHFTSFLFRHTNNPMGMRYPFSRATSAAGIFLPEQDTIVLGSQEELRRYRKTANTYAYYHSWEDAVKDYKLWQQRHFDLNERYLSFLSNVYAEDAGYIQKIRQLSAAR